jgi:GlpG protein
MRQIGHIEKETEARLFGDFLYVQGIENQIEPEAGHGWAIWIHAEEELERAGRLLSEFRAQPGHPRFRAQAAAAEELRAQAEKEQATYAKKIIDDRRLFPWLYAYGLGPLTLGLIIASVGVFCWSRFGQELEPIYPLFFYWPGILSGQVWRLVTPILIHFHILHIMFNLLWLRDLGSMIEARRGTGRFALLVFVIAAGSNSVQYFVGGPLFGGMSGVVYGLLGYVWMKGKFDPVSGLFLHPSTVAMMILWFFICLVGIIPGVANAAHGAGLVIGVVWGYLSSPRRI